VIRCCEELEHPYDGSTPRIEKERSKGEMGRRRKFKTIVFNKSIYSNIFTKGVS
jgi:hypothetical protein